jgi:hypothetical protein
MIMKDTAWAGHCLQLRHLTKDFDTQPLVRRPWASAVSLILEADCWDSGEIGRWFNKYVLSAHPLGSWLDSCTVVIRRDNNQ